MQTCKQVGGTGVVEAVDGDSKCNLAEAEQIISLLADVLAAGELKMGDVGVITPYSAQVKLLQKLWRERSNAAGGRGGGSASSLASDLEIATVDRFQGREKEMVIFSAVRNNARGEVGFLKDWRRLNVMLTRARRGLVVVGASETLRHDATWARWLAWVKERELFVIGGVTTAKRKRTDGGAV
jgi:regulator of nonsense transcripts 1